MSRTAALFGASLLVLAPLAAAPAAAQQAASLAVPPLEFTHRELGNGLDVYAMPDPTAGTVTVTLWYDVGGKDDPEGRSGFAHLFEHILSRKTVNLPYGQISTMVENAGGTRNASTGQDFTNYYETVPPQYLEQMLWTHAERMARPVVDQEVFDTERSIVQEELRQRVYAPPYGRLQRFVIGDNSFDESIYRRSVIGSLEELNSARIEDARAFHEAYYRPANATLIVSGNFDPAQLDRWVDQYFAGIRNPDRPTPVFERPVETPRTQPRLVEAYAPNVPLPAVAAIFPGVAAGHPDAPALDVLQAIMSRGESSRLYQALVYETQLAANAGFGLDDMEEDGVVTLTATVAQGKAIPDVEAALNAQLERIRNEPVTAAELQEAKTEIVASALRQRETASGRAFILGQSIVSQNDPRAADERLAAVQQVTAADVQRVARTYLDEQARVSIRYQDESARPAGVPEDSWRNPAPVPTFVSVPPAVLPPNELLPEGRRAAPPALGAAREAVIPAVAERTLPNGLRVIVAKSTDLPIMNAQLVLGGGAAADPADRPGLAGLTAGLATQGAGGRSAPEIARTLEALGANIGGGAGADATQMFVSAPIASAEAVGAVLADVVQRPDFAEAEVARSRTQAVNALRVNYRQPGPLASAVLNRLLYGASPYGAPSSGTPASVAAITRDEIVAFHDRWWRPDNATVIVTGGMEPEAAFAWAEQVLGGWERPAAPKPTVGNRAGAPAGPRVVVVDLPGAGQAAVTAAVRAPRRADAGYYPLAVANAVLGSGQNGRLFQEVRAKRGLSYGAYSSLGARAEGGALVASTQTKNESAAEVVGLVLAEFDRLAREPVADQAVTDREAFITGGFQRSLETTGGLGGLLADAVVNGLPLSEIGAYPQKIAATTPDSLREAARVVSAEEAVVVVVGQADMFIDALRAAHPDVAVIPAAELDLDSPTLGM
ncbi:MAG: insulinase family protein [Brevundimonas sp.]|uniref:M16 family metallopeptidase n=1 Tax=Brevundimonas sp. TaxID=1871086 RepID=UPI0017B5B623|nr:pitrilysin family protein [Brevundimonas sp.]MBA4804846.1 insulinase family protein [Brevundimonas sp.]